MMPLRPILSTLRRHKTAAALIVLEIALTCAIVCNAVFLIFDRVSRTQMETGFSHEEELVQVNALNLRKQPDLDALTAEDIAALRALPGVRAVTSVNMYPFGPHSQVSGANLRPDQVSPTIGIGTYFGDETTATTLGLRIVEGRDLRADEVGNYVKTMTGDSPVAAALVDQRTARRLFPKESAVGKDIWVFGDKPTRIVGVVQRLAPVLPFGGEKGPDAGYTVLFGGKVNYNNGTYFLRADPAQHAALMAAIPAVLKRQGVGRLIENVGTYSATREKFFRGDRTMMGVLVGVIAALLVVTAFGIVGLASFWVQQRTRMIGTRRALGATRAQIRHYFQAENLLLTTAGIALGMGGAFAINQWLMTQYELPRLPWVYLPVGALALWALGQVAVLAPARRAAAVPPALAMRGLT